MKLFLSLEYERTDPWITIFQLLIALKELSNYKKFQCISRINLHGQHSYYFRNCKNFINIRPYFLLTKTPLKIITEIDSHKKAIKYFLRQFALLYPLR